MGVKVALCLSVLFSLAASISCPSFTCDTLDTNMCASKASDGSFKLNENGCETGFYCQGLLIRWWATNEVYEKNTTISCAPGDFLSDANSTVPPTLTHTCLTPNPNKKFKNGKLVVSCSSDNDCLLVDGTNTTCFCAFNSGSNGYCIPSLSNEEFLGPDYWRDCGSRSLLRIEILRCIGISIQTLGG